MDFKKVKLPREIHTGPGIIRNTGAICRDLRFKGKVLVVSGPKTLKMGGEGAIASLQEEGFDVESITIKHPSAESVSLVENYLEHIPLVLGVGVVRSLMWLNWPPPIVVVILLASQPLLPMME